MDHDRTAAIERYARHLIEANEGGIAATLTMGMPNDRAVPRAFAIKGAFPALIVDAKFALADRITAAAAELGDEVPLARLIGQQPQPLSAPQIIFAQTNQIAPWLDSLLALELRGLAFLGAPPTLASATGKATRRLVDDVRSRDGLLIGRALSGTTVERFIDMFKPGSSQSVASTLAANVSLFSRTNISPIRADG